MSFEDRDLDARAAVIVDGWRDVRLERYGAEADMRGSPPEGLRRPVIHYSRDASRALHLARKAARITGRPIIIRIERDEVSVECDGESSVSTITAHLAAMLTRVATEAVERRMQHKTNAAQLKGD